VLAAFKMLKVNLEYFVFQKVIMVNNMEESILSQKNDIYYYFKYDVLYKSASVKVNYLLDFVMVIGTEIIIMYDHDIFIFDN
jgi:hypothetical protein